MIQDKKIIQEAQIIFDNRRAVSVYIHGNNGVGKKTIRDVLQAILKMVFDYLETDICINPKSRTNGNLMDLVSISIGDVPMVIPKDNPTVYFVIYDICDIGSYDFAIKTLRKLTFTSLPEMFKPCLVGNKIDLEYWRRVSLKDADNIATNELHYNFIEVSAFTGMNVCYMADIIMRQVFPTLNIAKAGIPKFIQKLQKYENERQDDRLNQLLKLTEETAALSSAISTELKEQSSMLDSLVVDEKKEKSKRKKSSGGFRLGGTEMINMKTDFKMDAHVIESEQQNMVLQELDVQLGALSPISYEISSSLDDNLGHAPLASISFSAAAAASTPLMPPTAPRLGSPQHSVIDTDRTKTSSKFEENVEAKMEEEDEDVDDVTIENISGKTIDEERVQIPSKKRKDADIQAELGEVKNILRENINSLLDRSESIESLQETSDSLAQQSLQFKKASAELKEAQILSRKCTSSLRACCCSILHVPFNCYSGIMRTIRQFSKRSALFDNVLADTENAFQTLAKFLSFLDCISSRSRSFVKMCIYGFWLQLITWILSMLVTISSAVVLILPSFFTLLIVRTNVVEKESKAFGVRQEVIRYEKKEESLVRWIRIILRSLPLTFYLLGLPYILVNHVFKGASKNTVTTGIVCYLVGIILLQVLGSIRAFYSWKSRDVKIPKPPSMFYSENETNNDCCDACCFSPKKTVSKTMKTRIPFPPNTLNFKNPANWMELASLTLEFLQMASFSLQNNPYENSEEGIPTAPPTLAPSGAIDIQNNDDEIYFWGSDLYQYLYVNIPVASDFQIFFMWAAVGLVCTLIALFSLQFLLELQKYGNLMNRIEDKDIAKDSFFFSFTGSIVYGHGKPKNISSRMRLVISLLSDGLFLVISVQLLQALACTYDDEGSPTLQVDESIICWEGNHAVLAVAALTSFAYYVPLSIMITPMLLEASSSDDLTDSSGFSGTVSYLKLYLMTINVVKSIMLIVTVLGPQAISTAVITTVIASFILGSLTLLWFKMQKLEEEHLHAEIQPCNIAFVNFWKSASYTAAVASSIIVVVAYEIGNDNFSSSVLTQTLLITWVIIILCFALSYRNYFRRTSNRRQSVYDLISYPFRFRDATENWSIYMKVLQSVNIYGPFGKIPGYLSSPWSQHCGRVESKENPLYDGKCLVEHLLTLNKGKT